MRTLFNFKYLLFIVLAVSNSLSSQLTASECVEINTELKPLEVITSGGFAIAFEKLVPMYECYSGHKINISYGSSSGGASDSIPERLKRDEYFDIIILSKNSLKRQTSAGYTIAQLNTDLVRSSIGMAVRKGASIPDISTSEAFIKTLKEAKSIGYSASASGTYLSTVLWPKLGIWEEIKDKSKRILSERVATIVGRGEVEIGFQQVSEIIAIKEADFVGKIPDDLQKVTVFSASVLKKSEQKDNSKRLLAYISGKENARIIEQTGLEPINK